MVSFAEARQALAVAGPITASFLTGGHPDFKKSIAAFAAHGNGSAVFTLGGGSDGHGSRHIVRVIGYGPSWWLIVAGWGPNWGPNADGTFRLNLTDAAGDSSLDQTDLWVAESCGQLGEESDVDGCGGNKDDEY
eukprot:SAG31_NODE_11160_length_1059_cov_1.954167_1_plen_134_part_00